MFVPKPGRYHRHEARTGYFNAQKQNESEIYKKKKKGLKVMFVSYLLNV